jgi:ribonuclease P protein component
MKAFFLCIVLSLCQSPTNPRSENAQKHTDFSLEARPRAVKTRLSVVVRKAERKSPRKGAIPMISKKKRFTRAEFAAFSAQKTLKQAYNRLGTVKFHTAETFKLAVVTSGKHQKSAVIRNKLRRRVYTIFGRAAENGALPYAIILYASKASYTFPYESIEQNAKDLIAKISRSA